MPKNVPKTEYVEQTDQGWLLQQIASNAVKDAVHVLTHIGGCFRGDFTQREGEQAHQGRMWAFGVLSDDEATK